MVSLLVGIWGILKGSYGVLVYEYSFNGYFRYLILYLYFKHYHNVGNSQSPHGLELCDPELSSRPHVLASALCSSQGSGHLSP